MITKGKESIYKTLQIRDLKYSSYSAAMFWDYIKIKSNDLPIPNSYTANFARAITICTIIAIDYRWKNERDSGRKEYQIDVLNKTVIDIAKYYEKNPQSFFKRCPDRPKTQKDMEKVHSVIIGLAKRRIISMLRPILTEEKREEREHRVHFNDNSVNEDINQTIEEQIDNVSNHNYIPEKEDLTELDREIISSDLDCSIITSESKNIISRYFIENISQIESLLPFFNNKMLTNLNPSDLWKIKVFEWKAKNIYSYLEKIDNGEELDPNEKGSLYLFYLMICISAIHQKWQPNFITDGISTMIITKKYIPQLTVLVIKTFLHFTKKLEQNVFSHFVVPPPETKSEVTHFTNLIKDKPRNLLKTINTPIKVVPSKLSYMKAENMLSDLVPERFVLSEYFESYEVFEVLTNKINQAFIDGYLDIEIDTSSLKAHLSDSKVELKTIFNFLNPMSQVEEQDYDYITKGALSAVTTGLMNCYKKTDGKLNITLTNNENSLNPETISKITKDLLEDVILKDYQVKKDEVSDLAKEIIFRDLAEQDIPLSVSIPEGTEYDSYRSMVEMNGSLQVQIPFVVQGKHPYWDDENVLDDKMVQMIDKSITNMINQANIGKEISKLL